MKNCIICENIIPRKNSGGTRTRVVRGRNSRTCSPKCSKAYRRVYVSVYNSFKKRLGNVTA